MQTIGKYFLISDKILYIFEFWYVQIPLLRFMPDIRNGYDHKQERGKP